MKTSKLALILFIAVIVTLMIPPAGASPPRASAAEPTRTDVVIIGSEIEGMYLARAAKDEGLSVLVLDPRERPGGQLLEGEMLFLDEPMGDGGESLVQGRMAALFNDYKKGKIRKTEHFRAYFEELTRGIPLESGITITEVDIRRQPDGSGRFVDAITYRTKDGRTHTVYPAYVVENTDFAALTSRLDLARIPGMESIIPTPDGSPDYMAATFMLKYKNVDWNTFQTKVMSLSKQERERLYGSETTVTNTFTWGFGRVGASYDSGRDDWFLRGLNIVNQLDGEVMINALLVYGVNPADPASIERALAEGCEQARKVLEHLRKTLPGWSKAELNGYPSYLYIRDFDRYETEYVLQGTDLMSGTMFWDNVSIGGYEIDLQGTIRQKWGQRKGNPDKYGMPLRSFLAKNYRNVIVAGKNVGASAVAYGSARIQAQTALAAEVIGIILGQIKGKYELADMTPERMKKLHEYIYENYGIRLAGVAANSRIDHLTEEEKALFNMGRLTVP